MTTLPDVLIVGGGIAGLTVALAAARRSLHVTIVHAPRRGEASRAAAGMLAPSVEGLPNDVLSIALDARDMYPRFLADLHERTGIAVSLDRNGILELASTDADLASRAARAGERAQVLDAVTLAAMEPSFAAHSGAILHPDDGAVDNVSLMFALEQAALHEPRIGRVSQDVTSIDVTKERPTVTTADGTVLRAGSVLLASGAWATTLPGLPRSLPVRPLLGQLLALEPHAVNHVTYGGGGYLIPRGSRLVVGATSEETGFECDITASGLETLRGIAFRVCPTLVNARVTDHWCGLRPVTPDALPVLGPDPDVPALSYACGFSRNGILLAPWAAEQLAESFTAERASPQLALFRIDRFSTSG